MDIFQFCVPTHSDSLVTTFWKRDASFVVPAENTTSSYFDVGAPYFFVAVASEPFHDAGFLACHFFIAFTIANQLLDIIGTVLEKHNPGPT